MLLFIGLALLALGLLSGVALVLGSLGVLTMAPGLTLWFTFPLLSLLGYGLTLLPSPPAVIRQVSMGSSALLLLLALTCVGVLVMGSAALIPSPADTGSLWFVFGVSLTLGLLGAASFSRSRSSD